MTSKFNQTRIYQRFGTNAKKLDKMPDYSNELIREKKEKYGAFVYDMADL